MDNQFPIGKLSVPSEITNEHLHEWLEKISTYTDRLGAVVRSLSDEQLNLTYREGAWNIRQLVHHIADSQLNMYQRLKLALTDDTPTVPNFDQDACAVQADTLLPVESSIKMLEGMNERIVLLVKSLTPNDFKRSFIHEKNGEVSVATKITKLCWHQEHHLAHIQLALHH